MLKHKTKTNVWVVIASVAIMTLVFISIYRAKVINSPKIEKYVQYTVGNGDTLWGIAEKYKIKNCDIRQVIFDIQRVNGIRNDVIKYGQVLEVPIYINK